ncbi:MAG: SIMPL domain-containing protein [Actinomycetota bacterium]|nr:SIMPL domain-containing protein [Actinomycetota bacterium]
MPATESEPDFSASPTVSVVGSAVLRAEPDEAMVVVILSALKDGPGPALEDVARRSEALVALLDELGIASSDRSTTGVSVHEDFDHTHEGRRSLGHRAESAIAVRLTALDLIGRLVIRATTELDARVDGPHWLAAENPVRLEAARQAAADGQRKAQAYAEGVGARLGALIRLTEPEAAAGSRRGAKFIALSASSGDMPVEAGEQEITATIEVTFALTP